MVIKVLDKLILNFVSVLKVSDRNWSLGGGHPPMGDRVELYQKIR